MIESYLRCSYSEGMFPTESVVKFLTTKGSESIFVHDDHTIRNKEKPSCREYEGQIKVSLYDQDKDTALIGIRDAGAGTGKLSTFRVPLEEIVNL
jgi:hypothetical protein